MELHTYNNDYQNMPKSSCSTEKTRKENNMQDNVDGNHYEPLR